MKHDLILTVETGELARLGKLAARQGLTIEEAARGVLLAAAYKEELTAQDEEAIRCRALPLRRPLVVLLNTADEYRLEKLSTVSARSMETEAAALLGLMLRKCTLDADDHGAIAVRMRAARAAVAATGKGGEENVMTRATSNRAKC